MKVRSILYLLLAGGLGGGLLLLLLFLRKERDAVGPIPQCMVEDDQLPTAGALPPSGRDEVADLPTTGPPVLEEDAARADLDFLVLDRRGRPIAGVEILCSGDTMPRILGSTDAAGTLRASWIAEPSEYLRVVARREGYARQMRRIGYQREGDVVIVLRDDAVIHGRVLDGSGLPVADVVVLATPSLHNIESQEEVDLVQRGLLPGGSAVTDAQGGFEIQGLAAGQEHVLVAAHDCKVSRRAVAVAGQPDPVILAVQDLVGAYLKAVSPDGSSLPDRRASNSEGIFLSWPGDRVEPLHASKYVLALTPLKGEPIWNPKTSTFFALGLAKTGGPEPLALPYGARWSGFQIASGTVHLETWGPGFPTHSIVLEPLPGGMGRLNVSFEMVPLRPSTCSALLVKVLLRSSADGTEREYYVQDPGEGLGLDLQAGSYEVVCSAGMMKPVLAPMVGADGWVAIHPGGVTDVAFRLEGFGAIELDVLDQIVPYDGVLAFKIRDVLSDRLCFPRLEGPPYVLNMLRPGEYAIEHVFVPEDTSFQCSPQTIRVAADGMSSATLLLN